MLCTGFLHAACRCTTGDQTLWQTLHPLIGNLISRKIGPVAKLHLANKTGDENRKALISKGNLSTLIRREWREQIMTAVQDMMIGSVCPLQNYPLYMNTLNTAWENSSQDTNNWQALSNEVIYFSSVHQHPLLWHWNVFVLISLAVWMFAVPLKMPHRTEGRMFADEASVSLWLSTSCLVIVCGRMCNTRGTAQWGMFTNHKLQLYVQTVYKTQSENSINKLRDQLMPWHPSNPNSKKWRLRYENK